jgi:hypothetical protein
MTLLDAQQYDSVRGRRRRQRIILSLIVLLVAAWLTYHFRHYPERKVTGEFFAQLQHQSYEAAYAIWFQDPQWQQHPKKYSQYQYGDFYRDWGPGGEWGLIKSYAVDCSLSPGGGSGVIVQVTVNSRIEHAYVWVEKANRTLSFSPTEVQCGNWWTWVTE